MVAFAGTASLCSDEDGERRGMPQRQSTPRFPCSRARGRQQGCRGALLPDPSQEGKQDSRDRRHGSVPAALLSSTHCTNSTFPPSLSSQNPLCSAATPATTLQRPCATPRPPKPSSGGWFLPIPIPRLPAGKESRVSTRTKERSAALQCRQRWEVEGPGSLRTWRCQTSIYR